MYSVRLVGKQNAAMNSGVIDNGRMKPAAVFGVAPDLVRRMKFLPAASID